MLNKTVSCKIYVLYNYSSVGLNSKFSFTKEYADSAEKDFNEI